MNDRPAPILIAGPTASGKSALALRLAAMFDGCIINADALQVYDCWSVLSACPDAQEQAQAPHHLYAHIGKHTPYSVGHWLRDVEETLTQTTKRPIIIGGTGLYFAALTKGLVEIPEIPAQLRADGNALRLSKGKDGFIADLQSSDPATLAQIDQNNPARLQRAWEVVHATGKGLSAWQAETPPPLIAPDTAAKITLTSDRDWLAERIDRRFDLMMEAGALDEVRAYISDGWDPTLPSAQAIGARELVSHLNGDLDLDTAIEQAKTQTRQYAKRQRTWFRSKMANWHHIDPAQALPERELHKIVATPS
ncbi:tRNA (adenosine(37)-N6)-dimethylallyltransferase MiaA [Amylibacter sp. IMCC11727]|uniref:tRNA (adenosine(37)-N6)-dimethylallyltransferase MiaA n=1 Tax=Amylibacter sp. IMCC11727 TaxID=3039851 RepID=UPI00244E4DC0|nr:tRNA (adenosine(37)-N6)-dimethylallyltransferase MiaA [Amylibacter sp. IMCC11727]WGI20695.1 tRNA (adenosine(37)-N6)-dimethylallyltransferase MiaA [Amylibacter sp. IMCC11727]